MPFIHESSPHRTYISKMSAGKTLQPNTCGKDLSTAQIADNPLKYLLEFPKGLKIDKENVIEGSIGHTCVYFKRPIIDGNYYFKVRVLDLNGKESLKHRASVRVGLCETKHSLMASLGSFENSFAYHSQSGFLLENGSPVEKW